MSALSYIGRFAPSPTGLLHAGSLVAAMASYLDAKAHQGKWLVRIEDIDESRTMAGATAHILSTLQQLGMPWDGDVVIQSQRKPLYAAAFHQIEAHCFPCACTRKEILEAQTHFASDGAPIYPGTCRHGLHAGQTPRTWRLRVPEVGETDEYITFTDRWCGQRAQHLSQEVGDFTLRRGDGFWAYQLAVVVDDAAQGITHVVRGADLLDSTERQIYLQHLLDYHTPAYCHVPLRVLASGKKLSKQNSAPAIDLVHAIDELTSAAQFLGIPVENVNSIDHFWGKATIAWHNMMLSRHAD